MFAPYNIDFIISNLSFLCAQFEKNAQQRGMASENEWRCTLEICCGSPDTVGNMTVLWNMISVEGDMK